MDCCWYADIVLVAAVSMDLSFFWSDASIPFFTCASIDLFGAVVEPSIGQSSIDSIHGLSAEAILSWGLVTTRDIPLSPSIGLRHELINWSNWHWLRFTLPPDFRSISHLLPSSEPFGSSPHYSLSYIINIKSILHIYLETRNTSLDLLRPSSALLDPRNTDSIDYFCMNHFPQSTLKSRKYDSIPDCCATPYG